MTGSGTLLIESFQAAREGRFALGSSVAGDSEPRPDSDRVAGLPGDTPKQPVRLDRPPRRKAAAPFSLRLSFAERTRLEGEAGDMPLGAYIRWRLFGDGGADQAGTRPPRQRQRRVVADQQALAQLLAKLGEARLANNLNQLAKAANTGSLPVTPETEAALHGAYAEVQAMRQLLLRGLGARESAP